MTTENIESLGWRLYMGREDKRLMYYQLFKERDDLGIVKYGMLYTPIKNLVKIWFEETISVTNIGVTELIGNENPQIIFIGAIDNMQELQILMKQLMM